MATFPALTDEQRANLKKLADYLLTLPADYPDFEMVDFTTNGPDKPHVAECGTAACAAGHGPAAGIKPIAADIDWFEYSERAFVPDTGDGAWDWCFSGTWAEVDNTAHGAAARILLMLSEGVPNDAYLQRRGRAPLSYLVEAA